MRGGPGRQAACGAHPRPRPALLLGPRHALADHCSIPSLAPVSLWCRPNSGAPASDALPATALPASPACQPLSLPGRAHPLPTHRHAPTRSRCAPCCPRSFAYSSYRAYVPRFKEIQAMHAAEAAARAAGNETETVGGIPRHQQVRCAAPRLLSCSLPSTPSGKHAL